MGGLPISKVAVQAEMHMKSLRYCKRRGLVEELPQSASNYRLYPKETLPRVRFIKCLQELEGSLNDIKELLSLRAEPGAWVAARYLRW